MNDTPPRGIVNDLKRVIGWIAFLCRALAFSAEVFLHEHFGPKYIGAQAAAVPALVLVYALCWSGYNLIPLFAFLAAYLGMCAEALLRVRKARRQCDQLPDYYSGCPKSMRNIRFVSERWTKRLLEPIYVFLIGWPTTVFDEPLGVYLMIVSGALLLSVNVKSAFARVGVKLDPSKPRPLLVQVRRVPREDADRFHDSSRHAASGARP